MISHVIGSEPLSILISDHKVIDPALPSNPLSDLLNFYPTSSLNASPFGTPRSALSTRLKEHRANDTERRKNE